MSLLPHDAEAIEQRLGRDARRIIGLMDAFRQRHEAVTPAQRRSHFMAFDRDNPSSIYSCLRAARENARAVRGTLTSEMWETLNATWLEMRAPACASRFRRATSRNFFEWVKYRSHLARGVVLRARCCATRRATSCGSARSSSAPTAPRAFST